MMTHVPRPLGGPCRSRSASGAGRAGPRSAARDPCACAVRQLPARHNGTTTQQKPPGVGFESWIDRLIRRATECGEFDDLPGSGVPLAGLDEPYDEMWWVKQKLRSEDLSYLPPSLALRKEAHDALDGAGRASTEKEVRERLAAINEKIRDAIRMGIRGPELNLVPFDVERIVRLWRRGQTSDKQ